MKSILDSWSVLSICLWESGLIVPVSENPSADAGVGNHIRCQYHESHECDMISYF